MLDVKLAVISGTKRRNDLKAKLMSLKETDISRT
jgi:hypothetical protein